MTRKLKEVNSPEEIPDFESEEEEAEFWSTHSFGDGLLEKMGPIPEGVLPPARPRTKPISMRFDEDVLARVKTLAETKRKGYQTLMKEFVVERLYEEEKREGILREPEVPKGSAPRGPGLPGEDWATTYRRLLVGSEAEWIDDPLSTIGSLMVVKAAMYTLGMRSREEFADWVRSTSEEEVRAKILQEVDFVRELNDLLLISRDPLEKKLTSTT